MSTRTACKATLSHELASFTGTETWWRHTLNRAVTYTDGVKHFADRAGAYWMVDILATELPVYARSEGFLSIKANVVGKAAKLTADDGNGKIVWTKHIAFTDCAEGDWRFFMQPGGPEGTVVIMLTSEY